MFSKIKSQPLNYKSVGFYCYTTYYFFNTFAIFSNTPAFFSSHSCAFFSKYGIILLCSSKHFNLINLVSNSARSPISCCLSQALVIIPNPGIVGLGANFLEIHSVSHERLSIISSTFLLFGSLVVFFTDFSVLLFLFLPPSFTTSTFFLEKATKREHINY